MAPLQIGSELVMAVDKPVAGGRMLGRVDGQVVLVSGAIPGERVRARVGRVARRVAFAETIEVLEASPDRRPPPFDPACGGSLYAHVGYARQLALKSEIMADAFARIAKMALPDGPSLAPSPQSGYRLRARLHVRGGRIGFFREGTHELCDPATAGQLLPSTVDALRRLEIELGAARLVTAASCELCENLGATERVVSLDYGAAAQSLAGTAAVEGITALDPGGYGSPWVVDAIEVFRRTATLRHHVRAFFQGNRHLLVPLAARVAVHAGEGDVLDLYAGSGLFSVAIAARGDGAVTAVEGDPFGAADLRINALPWEGRITVRHMSVEDYLSDAVSSDAPRSVVVDPPRTGLSEEAASGLARLRPGRIVYVSCDVATLARDVKRLVEAGYHVELAEGFDMFPNTPHIETVAVLRRRPDARRAVRAEP